MLVYSNSENNSRHHKVTEQGGGREGGKIRLCGIREISVAEGLRLSYS